MTNFIRNIVGTGRALSENRNDKENTETGRALSENRNNKENTEKRRALSEKKTTIQLRYTDRARPVPTNIIYERGTPCPNK